uniref:INO80 complex subunit E n=1 Tax=Anabas testudineus TaxID=64144 RepID=A0A3Q1JFM7_ANATE
MLCPAAVSAAAAAVLLLAVLGSGLSLAAEDNSDPGFNLCSHCFYRQMPPRGASAGPLLHPLCHSLPGGQTFATLSKPTCHSWDSNLSLLHGGWRFGFDYSFCFFQTEHNIKVAVPALLRGGRHTSHPISPTDSPLQHWDSTVTTLVQSNIAPQCSALGGDLYILTGAGGLRVAEDGDQKCQTKPLWSAVCCAVPGGESGFSVGLIREAGKGEKQVSVKELAELLELQELFSGGCGATDETDASGEKTSDNNLYSETVATEEEEYVDEVTQETSAGTVESAGSSEEQRDVRRSGAVSSDSPESPADYETVDEEETDTNSSSIVVCILSTTFSIITAPLRPVVSTVTQLPGQVTYVLQEDLGVLCALPGDIFSVFHLLASDLLSGMGSAAEMLLGIGDTIVSSSYFCTSSIVEALLTSCHTGVTGIGTLAGDTVGIFGDAVDNVWWVTKYFGGRLWEQSEDYVETVVSEMGGQVKAVGGGLHKLVWRSGNGVGNVFKLGGGLVTGMMDMVTGGVKEAFGNESDLLNKQSPKSTTSKNNSVVPLS